MTPLLVSYLLVYEATWWSAGADVGAWHVQLPLAWVIDGRSDFSSRFSNQQATITVHDVSGLDNRLWGTAEWQSLIDDIQTSGDFVVVMKRTQNAGGTKYLFGEYSSGGKTLISGSKFYKGHVLEAILVGQISQEKTAALDYLLKTAYVRAR